MGRIVGITYPIPEKHVCPNCGKEYKTEEGLQKHMEKEHAGSESNEQTEGQQ